MRRLLEGLDLSTSDDTPQQDLAAALLEIYEAQRVSGVREVPVPAAEPDVSGRVREMCQIILADRSQRVLMPTCSANGRAIFLRCRLGRWSLFTSSVLEISM